MLETAGREAGASQSQGKLTDHPDPLSLIPAVICVWGSNWRGRGEGAVVGTSGQQLFLVWVLVYGDSLSMTQGTVKTINRCTVKLPVHLAQAQSLTRTGLGSTLVLPGPWLGDIWERSFQQSSVGIMGAREFCATEVYILVLIKDFLSKIFIFK